MQDWWAEAAGMTWCTLSTGHLLYSRLTHRVCNMSKLILGTRGIHHNSSSEVLRVMRYVACHWISFGKPFPKFQGLFLLFTWDILHVMFESQTNETKNISLGYYFTVCHIDLFLMTETWTGNVNYHKAPVRKVLNLCLLQVCLSMCFSSQIQIFRW